MEMEMLSSGNGDRRQKAQWDTLFLFCKQLKFISFKFAGQAVFIVKTDKTVLPA
jgi:hypothetical protein